MSYTARELEEATIEVEDENQEVEAVPQEPFQDSIQHFFRLSQPLQQLSVDAVLQQC
jgi:hypothetical protein